MRREYDLIVLGSGSAGQMPAYRCRQEGWRVAMVEARLPGGTCANYGCDAKKPLANAAGLMDLCRRMKGQGVVTGEIGIDWPALIRFKNTFTDSIPERTRADLAEAGIDLFEGAPRFQGPREIQVGEHRLRGRYVVIATGRRPRPLGFTGEQRVTSSEELLGMERLPRRLVFIGGGYVSLEFAHVAARAGAHVTILEQMGRVLTPFDADLVEQAVEASRAVGIEIVTSSCVDSIERDGEGLVARCSNTGQGHAADLIVHGAGRSPSVEGLDLECGQVRYGPAGVAVNPYLQSVSNPAVYAAGDVADTPGPPLTPVSGLEGKAVAENLLHGNRERPDYAGIPTAIYTVPPLAAVGLTEADARRQGLDPVVRQGRLTDRKLMRSLCVEHAGYKVLLDGPEGRILGAHLLGPGADEVINLFALAIRLDLSAGQLKKVLYTYPTHTYNIRAML